MTRYLVTGGGGVVGRAVTAALVAEGADLGLLARSGSRTAATADRLGAPALVYDRHDDVSSLVAGFRPDAVIHLAAQQIRAPRGAADVMSLVEANIELGTLVLEGLRDSGAVMVQAMSYFQFRDARPAQHSLYAATKEALRAIGAYYRELGGVDVRDVVLFDNYGPADDRDKLVPYLVNALATGEEAVVGPLEQTIDLLHVDDVARGLVAAAGEGVAQTTAVRAAEPVTVGQIIAALDRVGGRSLRYRVDEARAVSDLPLHAGAWPAPPGWSPAWSLDRGLAQLVG
ncbi:MAG: NAD-dependent epimerase/dehydratase family protein [Pseudolysinimonas sp.]